LPLLLWPFLIIGIWEFVVSVGFLAQGKTQFQLLFQQSMDVLSRVELLPAFKFTGKMVKIKDFTGKW